jgi:hypothetical protein
MDSRYRRRRWARGLLAFVVGVLVFMAIGLAINAKLDAGQKPEAFPPTSLPVPPWDATTPPPPGPAASPALVGPVRITEGAQLVDGVYAGFPHSTAGAVSAAAEFAALVLSTLDPRQAAAVMRVAADPSFTAGPRQAAAGAVSDRESLGLPASGPVPDGYSFTVAPVECQVRGASASNVTVLLLAEFTSVTPAQGVQIRAGVFPVAVHWSASAGDWKVLPTPDGDYSSLVAEPDSPQAAALGWQDLQP